MKIKKDMWNQANDKYKEDNYEYEEEYCKCEEEDYKCKEEECECSEDDLECREENYECREKNDKYKEDNKIYNQYIKYKENDIDKHFNPEESKMHLNCKLKVDFDTKNKMIYLYPGKLQYFTMDVLKSCGDVIIKYKGCYPKNGICGSLGIYKIVGSGIVVKTYCKLDPRKSDFLTFTAIDKCTKESYDFVVVFSFDPCGRCY